MGSSLATPRTPSVPNSLRRMLIRSGTPPLVIKPQFDFLRRLAHDLHATGQLDLQGQLVGAGSQFFRIDVSEAIRIEPLQLQHRAANGDGGAGRRNIELVITVP